MKEFELTNKIRACFKKNENTPRVALTLNFTITNAEKNAGEYTMMNRLLMKGTKNTLQKNFLLSWMKMQ